MIINITLSKQSDPDLFNLYFRLGRKRFMKTIKETLRASILGKVGRLIYIPAYVPETEETSILLPIILTSRKDETLREYLEPMSSRSRTGYIKTILRLNLGLSFIRDEFFGIDSSQIEAKPLAYAQPQTRKISSVRSNPFQKKTTTATNASMETVDTKPCNPIPPVSQPQPPPQVSPVTSIPKIENNTQDDDDDLFSMLTNLIDD